MPYTERSRDNLLREGIHPQRILRHRQPDQGGAGPPRRSRSTPRTPSSGSGSSRAATCCCTVHRQETVDVEERLRSLLEGCRACAEELELPLDLQRPSAHARPARGVRRSDSRRARPVRTPAVRASSTSSRCESNARCVLTDSGTVQEECCIFGVPTVTCATPPSGRRPSSAGATCSAASTGGDSPLCAGRFGAAERVGSAPRVSCRERQQHRGQDPPRRLRLPYGPGLVRVRRCGGRGLTSGTSGFLPVSAGWP